MKRQFDAACRQYQVKKPVELENLWTNSVKWPLNGISYDPDTQTYTIPAGTPAGTWIIHTLTSPIPAGTTLTATAFFDGGYYEASRTAIYIGGVDSSNGWQAYSGCSKSTDLSGKRYSRTAVTTAPLTKFGIHLGANVDLSVKEPITFRMMLTVGETKAEAFKPYGIDKYVWADGLKSGFPSVKMLGQTEQQNYTGKNLYKMVDGFVPEDTWTSVQMDYDPSTEEYTLNGTVVMPGNLILAQLEPLWTTGETYTVTVWMTGGTATLNAPSGNTFAFAVFSADNKTFIRGSINLSEFPEKYVFTKEAFAPSGGDNPNMLLQLWNVGCVFKDFKFKIQMELGSQSTTYEPYVGGVPAPNPQYPQEVKANNATVRSCGKNLFNINWVNGAYDMLTKKGNEYGYKAGTELVANMGLYGNEWHWHDGHHFYTIPKGNWKVSAEFWVPSGLKCGSTVYLQFYNIGLRKVAIEKYQSIPIETWTKVELFFRVDATNTELLSGVSCRAGGVGDKNQYTDLGIRIRNVELMPADDASDMFTPYFDGGEATAPELYAIGDYKDEWDSQTGKGIRRVGKLVLDGTEAWTAYVTVAHHFQIGVGTNLFGLQFNPIVSTHYKPHKEQNSYWSAKPYAIMSVDGFRIRIADARYSTIEEFKAYLAEQNAAGTPVTVWYALAEPVSFETDPMPLTCPTGYGRIIQVAGDIPDCPMEIKYLAHGGNVK